MTRAGPRRASARALLRAAAEPFVVSVRSLDARASARASRRAARTSRRTSGSPPVMRSLLDAVVADEGPREPLDLLERRAARARGEELVVAPEDLLRHAVDAAEVAAVGDRDARRATSARTGLSSQPHWRSVAQRFRRARSGSLSNLSSTTKGALNGQREQVKGTLKEAEGKATDDKMRERLVGKVEKIWGEAKEKLDAKSKVMNARSRITPSCSSRAPTGASASPESLTRRVAAG